MDGIVWFALIVAAIVGVVIGMDAEKRGMSGIAWGIAVFAFMIIALPVYALVRKPPLSDQRARQEGST